jgi:hypothetical protein
VLIPPAFFRDRTPSGRENISRVFAAMETIAPDGVRSYYS